MAFDYAVEILHLILYNVVGNMCRIMVRAVLKSPKRARQLPTDAHLGVIADRWKFPPIATVKVIIISN